MEATWNCWRCGWSGAVEISGQLPELSVIGSYVENNRRAPYAAAPDVVSIEAAGNRSATGAFCPVQIGKAL
jgi:hypothetical protein